MANPLKELELAAKGFQFIQEAAIEAAPEKVWAAVGNVGEWFVFDPDRSKWAKQSLEVRAGGRWISESKDGNSSLHATVTYIEPGKLLRLSGQLGLTHLPVISVIIFELQPRNDGKGTLLRVGQRTFGFMDADIEKRYAGAWKQLLPQIKALAEKR